MKLPYLILGVLLIFLSVVSLAAERADLHSHAQVMLQTAQSIMQSDRTERLDVYCIPPNVLTRFALDPKYFERFYAYKITIRDFHNAPIKADLVSCLARSAIKDTKERPDIRWGCIFYNKGNARVLTIYFDGLGRIGLINGKPVTADGEFTKLLMRRCSRLWE